MSRITRATIKKFLKDNYGFIYINCKSSFDAMIDCVSYNSDSRFNKAELTDEHYEHTLGINGAWFVGSSRDRFAKYEDDNYNGYEIYNCCGSFILAIKKSESEKFCDKNYISQSFIDLYTDANEKCFSDADSGL